MKREGDKERERRRHEEIGKERRGDRQKYKWREMRR